MGQWAANHWTDVVDDGRVSPGSKNQTDSELRSLALLLLGLAKQGNCSWNKRGLVTDYSVQHEEATVQTRSAAKEAHGWIRSEHGQL